MAAPVDRYKVNDALVALFASFDATIDDETLDELTHEIADLIETAHAGAEAGRRAGMSVVIPPRDDWSGAPEGYYDES